MLKVRLEEKEQEAETMRHMIQKKEEVIKIKEGQKGDIKQQIEIDNADKENQIAALRRQLHQQENMMNGQGKLYNEL